MHELAITRFIAAPPERVWDVLAHRQAQWWCPRPWQVTITRQEQRAGGACDMLMHGPEGEEIVQRGLYLAWDEGRRFALTDAITAELMPAHPFMIGIWDIAPEGDGTRYTARARHWLEEDARHHEAMGFTQGWETCAEQLAALCEEGLREEG